MTVEDVESRRKGLRLCVERFFERHFASDFCSFDHRPDFEQKCHQDPLLAAAVIALCGRYLEAHDAQACFGLSSGPETSKSRFHEARCLAKASLDQPSGAIWTQGPRLVTPSPLTYVQFPTSKAT